MLSNINKNCNCPRLPPVPVIFSDKTWSFRMTFLPIPTPLVSEWKAEMVGLTLTRVIVAKKRSQKISDAWVSIVLNFCVAH